MVKTHHLLPPFSPKNQIKKRIAKMYFSCSGWGINAQKNLKLYTSGTQSDLPYVKNKTNHLGRKGENETMKKMEADLQIRNQNPA